MEGYGYVAGWPTGEAPPVWERSKSQKHPPEGGSSPAATVANSATPTAGGCSGAQDHGAPAYHNNAELHRPKHNGEPGLGPSGLGNTPKH